MGRLSQAVNSGLSTKHTEKQYKAWDRKVRLSIKAVKKKTHLRKGAKAIEREMKSIIRGNTKKRTGDDKWTIRYKKTGNRKRKGGSKKIDNDNKVVLNHENIGKRGGNALAAYFKGNLARSVRVFTFRRSPNVFVGPLFADGKGHQAFVYKGKTVDAYYAHMINNGSIVTKGIFYKEKAQARKEGEAKRIAIDAAMKDLRQRAKRRKIG